MFFPLLLQLVVVVVIAVTSWVWQGSQSAQALGYGCLVAVVNSSLLVLRWRRGHKDYHCDVRRHLKLFNRSAVERFFVVSMLLAVGFGFLELLPLAMLVGFIVGQLAWVLAMVLTNRLF